MFFRRGSRVSFLGLWLGGVRVEVREGCFSSFIDFIFLLRVE